MRAPRAAWAAAWATWTSKARSPSPNHGPPVARAAGGFRWATGSWSLRSARPSRHLSTPGKDPSWRSRTRGPHRPRAPLRWKAAMTFGAQWWTTGPAAAQSAAKPPAGRAAVRGPRRPWPPRAPARRGKPRTPGGGGSPGRSGSGRRGVVHRTAEGERVAAAAGLTIMSLLIADGGARHETAIMSASSVDVAAVSSFLLLARRTDAETSGPSGVSGRKRPLNFGNEPSPPRSSPAAGFVRSGGVKTY